MHLPGPSHRQWQRPIPTQARLPVPMNSLTAFCQRYGQEGWPALRQELPDLIEADINWLSDLSEEMEQHEPPTPIAVMDSMDAVEQNLEGTARSSKKRCSAWIQVAGQPGCNLKGTACHGAQAAGDCSEAPGRPQLL